ncbi:hypothetical protein RISW2_09245 [Roseivivax isoporae LMG 25204]|nr:hypothetical protein RISW2_09245 [Roseivivax isoporae LMG 25204]
MTSSRRLDVNDLSFSMKLPKIGMVDTKEFSSFAAGQSAHHLLCIRWEVCSALSMQVRREKFRVVPDGDI